MSACDFAVKDYVGAIASAPAGWTAATASATPGYTGGFVLPTTQSYNAMHAAGFVEYLPWRARMSNFWDTAWLASPVASDTSGVVGSGSSVFDTVYFSVFSAGLYTRTGAVGVNSALGTASAFTTVGGQKMAYDAATLSFAPNATATVDGLLGGMYGWKDASGVEYVNAAGRMMQKEALAHAQTAGFICIIVVQWADLTICKTRWLSIRDQGMHNPAMNFGLLFETILGAVLCYSPANVALGTRPLRLTHWFPGMPFAVAIFCYDEVRKYFMRKTSEISEDPETKRITRNPGWLERNTYY